MIDRDVPGVFTSPMACGFTVRTPTFDTNDALEQGRHTRAVGYHTDDCPRCRKEDGPVK